LKNWQKGRGERFQAYTGESTVIASSSPKLSTKKTKKWEEKGSGDIRKKVVAMGGYLWEKILIRTT